MLNNGTCCFGGECVLMPQALQSCGVISMLLLLNAHACVCSSPSVDGVEEFRRYMHSLSV
jgi:hypothetical protein